MQNPETRSGQGLEADEITLRLTESFAADNVIVLKFGPNLLDELEGLTNSRRGFDVVIVDTTDAGFLFPSEKMIAASTFAREFLEVQGALVFVTKDRAAAFIKESPAGFLSFHLFDSFSMVYDYSASIAKYIQQAMGQSIQIRRESTDLAEQILLTIIPVLTNLGIKMKASVEGSMRRNIVFTTIDNYTPLNAISQRLSAHMKFDEALEEFKLLEKAGAIYPIFPKIPFLVQHFRNGRQFKLRDYLLEAQLLSREQLDNALDSMQNAKGAQRLSLGAMCVAKGFLSARQLEIAMQDQAFFGQMRGTEKVKMRIETEDDNQVHSLIGSLKTTDSAGVLQNLASNRANGVLVVEFKDLTFRAVFDQGKLSFAKQLKLSGNAAVTEFVSVWKEGVYVFIERTPPPDLVTDECKITRPLDKLLLDSALACDNIEVVWKKLSAGESSILEKLPDHGGLLVCEAIKDPQEGYELNFKEV
ncbi:MAG: DUF4388 domain-containing protein, partial [Candidatus Obscuribacterales bacterium]|nr:DUF4388 domain-containing protein [Candidatus Obscuribacterales bacterium]